MASNILILWRSWADWGLRTLRTPVIGRAVLISSSGLLTSGQPCLLLSTPTLLRSTFIGIALEAKQSDLPEQAQFDAWNDLVQATVTSPHVAAAASDAYQTVEAAAYAEVTPPRAQDPLGWLAYPKGQMYGHTVTWIWWRDRTSSTHRGRLRQAGCLEADTTHPVILDPVHQITKLMSGGSTLACWRAWMQIPSPWWFIARHGTGAWLGQPLCAPWSRQPRDQWTADLWPLLFKEPKALGLRLSSYYFALFTTSYNCIYLYLTYDHKSIFWLACMRY